MSTEEVGSERADSEYSWIRESDNDGPFYEEKPEVAIRSLEERQHAWQRWRDARIADERRVLISESPRTLFPRAGCISLRWDRGYFLRLGCPWRGVWSRFAGMAAEPFVV